MTRTIFTDAHEAWKALRGKSQQAQQVRANLDEEFKRAFPSGHHTSLRNFALKYARESEKGRSTLGLETGHVLSQAHPRAHRFIATYGSDYHPFDWAVTGPQHHEPQPELGQCASNTHVLMSAQNNHPRRSKWVYVEGLVMGPLVKPMLHAWNAAGLRSVVARDWTLYAGAPWCRYLGIPLTAKEYERCRALAGLSEGSYRMLFDRDCFPKVETYLEGLMTTRLT